MLCKGVKRNFLFGERLEAIRDRSIYRLLYAFWKLKNSPHRRKAEGCGDQDFGEDGGHGFLLILRTLVFSSYPL